MIGVSIGGVVVSVAVALALLWWTGPLRRSIPPGSSDPSPAFPWLVTLIVRAGDSPAIRLTRWHATEAEARRWALTTGDRLRTSFPRHRIGWTVSRRALAE